MADAEGKEGIGLRIDKVALTRGACLGSRSLSTRGGSQKRQFLGAKSNENQIK